MPKRPATPQGDSAKRAGRTALQAGAVQALIQLWNAFAVTDITIEQAAILTTLGTPLLSFLQGLLEEQRVIPPLLKEPPPPPVPTIDPVMQAELEALAGAVADLRADLRSRPIGSPKP